MLRVLAGAPAARLEIRAAMGLLAEGQLPVAERHSEVLQRQVEVQRQVVGKLLAEVQRRVVAKLREVEAMPAVYSPGDPDRFPVVSASTWGSFRRQTIRPL
ncbi:MAG: hypothetical protein RIS70_678 [Planctomycetota bacterium]